MLLTEVLLINNIFFSVYEKNIKTFKMCTAKLKYLKNMTTKLLKASHINTIGQFLIVLSGVFNSSFERF